LIGLKREPGQTNSGLVAYHVRTVNRRTENAVRRAVTDSPNSKRKARRETRMLMDHTSEMFMPRGRTNPVYG